MNRKARRALKRHVGADAQEKMATQMEQFGKMPQSCDACQKEFDKKDREMLQSWRVVVRQEVVRLFCPDCIKKTQEVLENASTKDKQTST